MRNLLGWLKTRLAQITLNLAEFVVFVMVIYPRAPGVDPGQHRQPRLRKPRDPDQGRQAGRDELLCEICLGFDYSIGKGCPSTVRDFILSWVPSLG